MSDSDSRFCPQLVTRFARSCKKARLAASMIELKSGLHYPGVYVNGGVPLSHGLSRDGFGEKDCLSGVKDIQSCVCNSTTCIWLISLVAWKLVQVGGTITLGSFLSEAVDDNTALDAREVLLVW